MKRRVFKWLSTVLAVVMLMGLIVLPASASGSCNGNHHFVSTGHKEGTDCVWGNVDYVIYTCTECGVWYTTGTRSNGGGGGHHEMQTVTLGGCSANPVTQEQCTKCDYRAYPKGGQHSWTEQITQTPTCTVQGKKILRCKCGETREETIPTIPHTYGQVLTKAPTCTEDGGTYQECSVCHNQKVLTVTPASGHRWEAVDPYDPAKGEQCRVCGEIQGQTCTHATWSDWRSDASGHWLECLSCKKVKSKSAHTDANRDGKCDVCGYVTDPRPATCQHQWDVGKSFGVMNHYETCSVCGETRQVSCYTAGREKPRTYCTDPTYCQCGNMIKEGQKNHNFGTWICHDDTHEHRCLNRDCQYGSVEHHNVVVVNGVAKCSVCNYTIKTQSAPHVHTFGAWTVGPDGCVAHCTDPACMEVKTSAHVPGAADCAGNAVCVNCGAAVTTTPSPTHTGPTEIRNAKAAEVGVAGYTGDTWCLTCNKVIATGRAIEALKPSHVHAYTVKHDSNSHWQECDCGAREGDAAHTYVGGVCSCGEKEPVKAPVHVHSYSAAFKSDSACHWHECTSCGEKIEREDHLFIDGKCACGMTYGGYEALVGVKDEKNSVVNVFYDVRSDGFYTLSVQRMYNAGLMKGKGAGFFDVNGTANRKEFMSVLARLNNVEGSNVSATWDTASVNWCVEKGYAVRGDVNAQITRAEIVTILWKMTGKPTVSYDLGKFTDSGELTGETLSAMKWAVANGIMYGRGNTIQPESDANRGEIASFVARYIDLMKIDEKAIKA